MIKQGILSLSFLLIGCTGPQNLVPLPEAGDCYVADRSLNASPMIGASGILRGNMVKAGCFDLIKEVTKAKKAGIDIDLNRLLGL